MANRKARFASYKALGLPCTATKAEIFSKYRELAYHLETEQHQLENKSRSLEEYNKITEAAIFLLFDCPNEFNLDDLYRVFVDKYFGENSTCEIDEEEFKYLFEISTKIDKEVAAENARRLISEEEKEKIKLAKKRAKNKKKKEKKKQKKNISNEFASNIFQEEVVEKIILDDEEEIDLKSTFVAEIAKKKKLHIDTPKYDPLAEIYSYCHRATEMFKNGLIPEAIELFSKAIDIEPLDYRLYINRSFLFLVHEELERALEDVQKCIDLCPSFPHGYFHKGKVLIGLKKFASAEECFKEALNLDDSYDDAFIELIKVQIYQITQMGFTLEEAKIALSQNNSVQEAVESLLSTEFSRASVAEGCDNVLDDESGQ